MANWSHSKHLSMYPGWEGASASVIAMAMPLTWRDSVPTTLGRGAPSALQSRPIGQILLPPAPAPAPPLPPLVRPPRRLEASLPTIEGLVPLGASAAPSPQRIASSWLPQLSSGHGVSTMIASSVPGTPAKKLVCVPSPGVAPSASPVCPDAPGASACFCKTFFADLSRLAIGRPVASRETSNILLAPMEDGVLHRRWHRFQHPKPQRARGDPEQDERIGARHGLGA